MCLDSQAFIFCNCLWNGDIELIIKHLLCSRLDGLFHRILTRAVRWSQEQGGREPRLFFRQARFFLNDEHDALLEMAPARLARIKVDID